MRDPAGAEFASCGIMVDYEGAAHPRLAGRDRGDPRGPAPLAHGDGALVHLPGAARGADRRHRPRRRDHPGQPERGLGPGAAGRAPPPDRPRGPAAGPGGLGRLLVLRPPVGDQGRLAALDARSTTPILADCRPGAARVYAQLSFAYACLRQRGDACRWAWRALRSNWHERRVPFALAVAAGIVPGDTVLRHAQRTRARDLNR